MASRSPTSFATTRSLWGRALVMALLALGTAAGGARVVPVQAQVDAVESARVAARAARQTLEQTIAQWNEARAAQAQHVAAANTARARLLESPRAFGELQEALRLSHASSRRLIELDRTLRQQQAAVHEAEGQWMRVLQTQVEAWSTARAGAPPTLAAQLDAQIADALATLDAADRPLPQWEAAPLDQILAAMVETPEELRATADEIEDHARRLERQVGELEAARERSRSRDRLARRSRESSREASLFDEPGVRRSSTRAVAANDARGPQETPARGGDDTAGGAVPPLQGGDLGTNEGATPPAPQDPSPTPEFGTPEPGDSDFGAPPATDGPPRGEGVGSPAPLPSPVWDADLGGRLPGVQQAVDPTLGGPSAVGDRTSGREGPTRDDLTALRAQIAELRALRGRLLQQADQLEASE